MVVIGAVPLRLINVLPRRARYRIAKSTWPWQKYGNCYGMDPRDTVAVFFPVSHHPNADVVYEEAKDHCRNCPVKKVCLDEALYEERRDPFGYRGDMTPKQRFDLYIERRNAQRLARQQEQTTSEEHQ